MASIFTKIIQREVPGYIISETPDCIAFLDLYPLAVGHTLVVPKKEIDDFFDVEDTLLCTLTLFAKRISRGIQKTVPCLRVGMAVVGLEVPHAHLHLVPLHSLYDIDFKKPKLHQSPEELEQLAQQLRAATAA